MFQLTILRCDPLKVPRGRPLHPEFALAVFVLDREGLPYAELWRRIRPVANRLGERQPSYSQVRRLALATRPVKRLRKQELDLILSRTLAGLTPIPL